MNVGDIQEVLDLIGRNDLQSLAVATVVTLLGLPTIVISIISAASSIATYIKTARAVGRGTQVAGTALVNAIRTRPSLMNVASLIVTIMVPIGQALVVVMQYVLGNYASLLLTNDQERMDHIVQVVTDDPWHVLTPHSVGLILQCDRISMGYVVVNVAFLLWSYTSLPARRRPRRSGDDPLDIPAGIMALPAVILGGVTWLGFCILLLLALLAVGYIILALILQDYVDWAFPSATLVGLAATAACTGICLLYFRACRAALRGGQLIRKSWLRAA